MAGKISSLLHPARIALHVAATARTAALRDIARLLDGHPDVTSFAGFYDELLARDRLDTTSLGNVMAVGRSDTGIPFDDQGEIVNLIFVLGTPKAKPGDYLAVVSALCRILKDPAHRATLVAAPTPEAFIAAIEAIEAKLKLG